jgi:hypothetical protein
MKSLLILVTTAGLILPFAAACTKTVVEDKDRGHDRGGSTVREDTTVRERESMHDRDAVRDRDSGSSNKTYERETEKTRD